MTNKTMPGLDDLVQARRRKGYGAVRMDTPNLTKPKEELIHEGHLVLMRFEEAVGREDFEVVGWEDVTSEQLAEKG